MYYIYAYVDPRTNLPFYIGKGSGRRKFSHIRGQAATENKRKRYIIEKLLSIGLEPRIDILVDNIDDETEAYNIENEFIVKYGRAGYDPDGILTNVILNNVPPRAAGVDNGMYGKRHTEESIAKMKNARKGKPAWNRGISQTQEVKDAVSAANKGKVAWNRGVSRTDEEKAKMSATRRARMSQGLIVPHNKGKKVPDSEKIVCEYCGVAAMKSNYTRWHGANCRNKGESKSLM